MLLNVLGCTRTTLMGKTSCTSSGVLLRNEWEILENSIVTGIDDCNYSPCNEECLVEAIHQIALITSLSFVHTARRCYRLAAK
jgi:hypothetical protein